MNFLKSFGQAVLKGVGLLNTPAGQTVIRIGEGLVETALPGATPLINELNQIAGAVMQSEVTVEAIKAAHGGNLLLTGADKLQAAKPLVMQIIKASNLLDGHKIQDEVAFDKAVEGITSNVADLLMSLAPKQ